MLFLYHIGGQVIIQMNRQQTVELVRERLGAVVKQTGLSLAAFARKTGVDRSTLAQILSTEGTRLPRVETLTAIAQSEQVSIDWLVGLSQEGGLRADLVKEQVEIQPGGSSPGDVRIAVWHTEAAGFKIRSVPTTLPDMLKTAKVIEHEYSLAELSTPEARLEVSRQSLNSVRRPDNDTEICTPIQALEALAQGEGVWRGLPLAARREQLHHMHELVRELYPTLRWFLYDGRHRYSVPLTIFGPIRCAIYLGQMYLVLNGREQIEALKAHFDELIRAAVVQPPDIPRVIEELLATL